MKGLISVFLYCFLAVSSLPQIVRIAQRTTSLATKAIKNVHPVPPLSLKVGEFRELAAAHNPVSIASRSSTLSLPRSLLINQPNIYKTESNAEKLAGGIRPSLSRVPVIVPNPSVENELMSYQLEHTQPMPVAVPCPPAPSLHKRALLSMDISSSSMLCPALDGGTSSIRRKDLCKSLKKVLDWSESENELVNLDASLFDRNKRTCEHMVELESVERGFRAEVRVLLDMLARKSPILAKQVCQEYTQRVHGKLKDIANGPDNMRLVANRIEGPKGQISRGTFGIEASMKLDPTIKLAGTKAYLESYPDIQDAHSKLAANLDDLFTTFAKDLKIDCPPHLQPHECSAFSYEAVKDHIRWIGKSGKEFLESRMESMRTTLHFLEETIRTDNPNPNAQSRIPTAYHLRMLFKNCP